MANEDNEPIMLARQSQPLSSTTDAQLSPAAQLDGAKQANASGRQRSKFAIRGRQKSESNERKHTQKIAEVPTISAVDSDAATDDGELAECRLPSGKGSFQSQSLNGNESTSDAQITSAQDDLSAGVTDAAEASGADSMNPPDETNKKDTRKGSMLQRLKTFLWSAKSGKNNKEIEIGRSDVVAVDQVMNSNSHISIEHGRKSPQLTEDSTVEKEQGHHDDTAENLVAQEFVETDDGVEDSVITDSVTGSHLHDHATCSSSAVEDSVTESDSNVHGSVTGESDLQESTPSGEVDGYENQSDDTKRDGSEGFDEVTYEQKDQDSAVSVHDM